MGTVKCSAFHVWGGWASLSQPGLDLVLPILTSAFLPFQGETDPSGSDETQQFPLIPAHTRDWKFTFSLSSHSFLYLHSSLYFLPCFITIYLYPIQRFLLIQVWVVYKQEFHFSVSAPKYLFKKCSLNICDDYFKVRICLPMQEIYEILVWSMSQEDPLEKEMATHSSILAGKHSVDRGAWRALSPWGHKESSTTEWLSTHFRRWWCFFFPFPFWCFTVGIKTCSWLLYVNLISCYPARFISSSSSVWSI